MKILEVRDGFVKIESEKKIEISSFLELKGLSKRYVAQVIRSKNNGTGYNVYAKILFIYDGMLRKYDKTMPDFNAEISEFSFDTVNNSFNYSNPIVAGKFVTNNANILLDSEIFNNSTLISIDTPEMNDIVVQNLTKQSKQLGKTIIIDMLGILNGDKYIAGRDFKLPLNKESLEFIYEDCLNDATSDSKSLIKDIFSDLAKYSETVDFLPFNVLKTIVDDMVEKSHIFKLLILKNKLSKFDEAGYFASGKDDASNLSKLLNSNFAIIDLSKVDSLFQNRYLSVILSELDKSADKSTVFAEISNAINKKNIKKLLYSDNIQTTMITHSKFKYLSGIKPLFKNYIIEKSSANKDIFNLYSFFIESMDKNHYLIVGESTNYVPVISTLEKYDIEISKLPQDAISEEVIVSSYDSQVAKEMAPQVIHEDVADLNLDSGNYDDLRISEDEQQNYIEDSTSDNETISESAEDDSLSDSESQEPINSIFNEETNDDITENNETSEIINNEVNDDTKTLDENEESIIPEEINTDIASEEIDNNAELLIEDDNAPENESLTNEDDNLTESNESELIEDAEIQEEQTENNVVIPDSLSEDFDAIEHIEDNTDEITENLNVIEDDNTLEQNILPINNQDDNIGDFEELDDINSSDVNISDEDILVDLNDDSSESLNIDNAFVEDSKAEDDNSEDDIQITLKAIDSDIVEDVDKVFTTMKDDNLSDSDLDLIDSLNDYDDNNATSDSENEYFSQNDVETLDGLSSEDDNENEGFLEPLQEISDANEPQEQDNEILETKESTTPIIPIYDAGIPDEDKVISDEIEQGDTVVHAKYGSGVVEKMIKYGNKNLYSINFDNVGRRLLDPTLTEIKKA